MKYFIRSIKYFLYLAVFFSIIVTVMFYTSSRMEGLTVLDLFPEDSKYKILGFFVAFSAIYPLLGFSKKEIYVSNFNENKKEIITLFENGNFILSHQDATQMVFRHRNKFLRLMRMYEDSIIIDFSSNPILISGLRKDILRFSRGIEYTCRQGEE